MRALSVAVLLLGACSFVDDFDKFRAREVEAGGDANVGEDAQVDVDAAVALDARASDATGVSDAAAVVGDARAVVDCQNAVDGTRCGDGFVCRFQVCAASVCGDGFIDALRGESCDEANQVRHDGCEPGTCTFSCDDDGDCDDGRLCNGPERCDLSSHRCSAGSHASVSGQRCTTAANIAGACAAGLCVPERCGNGKLDEGETCELSTPGCRADCQPGCTSDADCGNDDACDGAERCDLATRECRAGERLACTDDDACTVDGLCDPASGCAFKLLDEDRDGYSPPACAARSGRAADCNDQNANVWPGASERCDGIDNDCDGQIDEGLLVQCFPDEDGDGFPARTGMRMACVCPLGTLAVATPMTYSAWDCWDDPLDSGASAFPGQTRYFDEGYGPGGRRERNFDYDCDGRATPRYAPIDAQGCTGLLGVICDMKQGFAAPVPSCGESGMYVTCGNGPLACEAREQSRKQECR